MWQPSNFHEDLDQTWQYLISIFYIALSNMLVAIGALEVAVLPKRLVGCDGRMFKPIPWSGLEIYMDVSKNRGGKTPQIILSNRVFHHKPSKSF